MKVRPSVKPMCEKCKIIKRKGKVMVICPNVKHRTHYGNLQQPEAQTASGLIENR